MKQIFGRQPVAIIAAIQTVLLLLVSFGALAPIGLRGPDDVLLVAGVLNGLAAVYLAYGTTETLLAPVVETFKAALALATVWGLSLSAEQSGLAVAAITAVFALVHQDRTSPQAELTLDPWETHTVSAP